MYTLLDKIGKFLLKEPILIEMEYELAIKVTLLEGEVSEGGDNDED